VVNANALAGVSSSTFSSIPPPSPEPLWMYFHGGPVLAKTQREEKSLRRFETFYVSPYTTRSLIAAASSRLCLSSFERTN